MVLAGVKSELGFAYFWQGKVRFPALHGTGCIGLRFAQNSHDDRISAMGHLDLVEIWAAEWEQEPPFRTLLTKLKYMFSRI